MALTVVSCRDDELKLNTLGGIIEDAPVADDSKVYLSDRERWLRWETGDQIKVFDSHGNSGIYGLDPSSHKQLNGNFNCESESGVTASTTIYGFYPSTIAPSGIASTMTLNLPSSHPYRNSADPTHPDSSFGKGAMPMVAFRDASDTRSLRFHSLAGILRFQLYAGDDLTDEATDEFTVTSITFEAQTQRLSGAFTITQTDLEDNQPHVEPVANPSNEDMKVTITAINQTIGGTGIYKNNLLTFYLPLPAVANPYGEETHKTTYSLKMHVVGTQNGNTKYFVRTLTVDIRRLSITMMPAMEINGVVVLPEGTGSEGTPHIVGSGTQDRPFQIYTADQLVYLRDRMNAGLTVSGQPVTENTYVKICRSDITLLPPTKGRGTKTDPTGTSAVWTEGFSNFTGKMYFSSSAGENGGITNISGHPLFEKISSTGHVERVYVKGELTLNSGSGDFSPMCYENQGVMVDCHNRCNVTSTVGHNLAGLCVTNSNTIVGGANDALLHSTGGNVAGICYTNSGTLQGNFSLSSAVPQGDNIAGICYTNEVGGTVADCQVSANIPTVSSTGNWGVVVFENSGTVQNCRSVGTIVFTTSGSIGGVVHTNTGTVHDCSLNVTLRGGSGSVGGIVAVMNGGTLRNCYADGDYGIYGIPRGGAAQQANYAGGIVGWLHAGSVYNCYNRCSVTGAVSSGTVLGRLDVGAVIENCWSDISHSFLGYVNPSSPEQGEIGPFCFSGYSVDTNLNCVLILNNWYCIMVPWNLYHKVEQAEAAGPLNATMTKFKLLTYNYYKSDYYGTEATPPDVSSTTVRPSNVVYLCDALNTWVNSNGANYRSWTSTTSANYDIYPVYTNLSKSKHYRHSSKSSSTTRNTVTSRTPRNTFTSRTPRKSATRR